MGWSRGVDRSRPEGDQDIGYGVAAVCDHPGCDKKIDRGLAYACGGNYFEDVYGCNGYFCEEHLTFAVLDDGSCVSLCPQCLNRRLRDELL